VTSRYFSRKIEKNNQTIGEKVHEIIWLLYSVLLGDADSLQ
jgi:hypothetical protein